MLKSLFRGSTNEFLLIIFLLQILIFLSKKYLDLSLGSHTATLIAGIILLVSVAALLITSLRQKTGNSSINTKLYFGSLGIFLLLAGGSLPNLIALFESNRIYIQYLSAHFITAGISISVGLFVFIIPRYWKSREKWDGLAAASLAVIALINLSHFDWWNLINNVSPHAYVLKHVEVIIFAILTFGVGSYIDYVENKSHEVSLLNATIVLLLVCFASSLSTVAYFLISF